MPGVRCLGGYGRLADLLPSRLCYLKQYYNTSPQRFCPTHQAAEALEYSHELGIIHRESSRPTCSSMAAASSGSPTSDWLTAKARPASPCRVIWSARSAT